MTSMPKIFAICGFKRSGKDTVADYLVQRYGYTKVKIADPLKAACKLLFGLDDEQVDGHLKEVEDQRWGKTPREIMQFFGTDIMQYAFQSFMPELKRTFWVKNLCMKYKHTDAKLVVADLRFHHELEEFKKLNAKCMVIKVISDKVDTSTDEHVSEREWMTIQEDVCIHNNGTLEELYAKIDSYLSTFNQN